MRCPWLNFWASCFPETRTGQVARTSLCGGNPETVVFATQSGRDDSSCRHSNRFNHQTIQTSHVPQASGTCNLVRLLETTVRCHKRSRVEPSSSCASERLPAQRIRTPNKMFTEGEKEGWVVILMFKLTQGFSWLDNPLQSCDCLFFMINGEPRIKLRYVDFWQRTLRLSVITEKSNSIAREVPVHPESRRGLWGCCGVRGAID